MLTLKIKDDVEKIKERRGLGKCQKEDNIGDEKDGR